MTARSTLAGRSTLLFLSLFLSTLSLLAQDDCPTAGGGTIALISGGDELSTCAGDGVSDAFDVTLTGQEGDSSAWVITDAELNILGLPPAPPFDLEGAGPGTCLVWHLAFDATLSGAMVGANVADLTGCYDLSNPITVERYEGDDCATNVVSGGSITLTATGGVDTSICVDGVGDPLMVTRDGSADGPNRGFVITDEVGNILGLPNNDGPFDLDPAGPGTCLIWYLAYLDGLEGLAPNENIADLAGTHDFSNPITVVRQAPDGGRVTTIRGDTVFSALAGSVRVPVTHTTTASALSYWYVITDDDSNILGFANAMDTDTLDLSAAPAGTCRIYGWSYRDQDAPVMGENISTLTDGGCEAISDNYIEVIRTAEVNGGAIFLTATGGVDTSICVDGVGDPLMVTRDGNGVGDNRTFVITDDQGNILGLPGSGPFDLDPAGPGTCLIWYLAYSDGLMGLEMNANVDNLMGVFDFSNPITVDRQAPDGGRVTTASGDTTFTAVAGNIMVPVMHTTTATALDYWYVITDDDNGILGFANSAMTGTLDLSGAPAGTCRIYGWSYRGLDNPVMGEDISTLTDDSCEAISENYIEVIRTATPENGRLTISEVDNSGRIEIYNGGTDTVDLSGYWLCNRPAYQQLSTLAIECGELDLAPGEVVVVTGFTGFNGEDAELGLYSTNEFGSAEALVSYLEWGSAGHGRAPVAIEAGLWEAGLFFPAPPEGTSLQNLPGAEATDWVTQTPSFCTVNSGTTSTAPPLDDDQVSLYPNPVTSFLTLELSGLTGDRTTVEIIDVNGRRIEQRFIDGASGLQRLPFASAPAGTYFLRVTNAGRSLTRLFVKL